MENRKFHLLCIRVSSSNFGIIYFILLCESSVTLWNNKTDTNFGMSFGHGVYECNNIYFFSFEMDGKFLCLDGWLVLASFPPHTRAFFFLKFITQVSHFKRFFARFWQRQISQVSLVVVCVWSHLSFEFYVILCTHLSIGIVQKSESETCIFGAPLHLTRQMLHHYHHCVLLLSVDSTSLFNKLCDGGDAIKMVFGMCLRFYSTGHCSLVKKKWRQKLKVRWMETKKRVWSIQV